MSEASIDPVALHLLRGTVLMAACWLVWVTLIRLYPRARAAGYTFWRGVILLMTAMMIVQLGQPQRILHVVTGTSDSVGAGAPADPAVYENLKPFGEAGLIPQARMLASAAATATLEIDWRLWLNRIVQVLLSIWSAGVVLGVGRMIWARCILLKRQRSAFTVEDPWIYHRLNHAKEQLGVHRRIDLLEHPCVSVPVTWGVLRPRILLPVELATWTEKEQEMALLHEVAHIRARDALFQGLASVLRVLHWINPLVWLSWRQFALDREMHADSAVLTVGASPPAYAAMLVRLASRSREAAIPPSTCLSMARASSVPERVTAILERKRQVTRQTGPAIWLAMILLAGVAVTLGLTSLAHKQSILPRAEESQVVRLYAVPPQILADLRAWPGADLTPWLQETCQLKVTDNATSVFNPTTSQLVARNTASNHRRISDWLQSVANEEMLVRLRSSQVRLSSRALDHPDLAALIHSNTTPGTVMGAFSPAQYEQFVESVQDIPGVHLETQVFIITGDRTLTDLPTPTNGDTGWPDRLIPIIEKEGSIIRLKLPAESDAQDLRIRAGDTIMIQGAQTKGKADLNFLSANVILPSGRLLHPPAGQDALAVR